MRSKISPYIVYVMLLTKVYWIYISFYFIFAIDLISSVGMENLSIFLIAFRLVKGLCNNVFTGISLKSLIYYYNIINYYSCKVLLIKGLTIWHQGRCLVIFENQKKYDFHWKKKMILTFSENNILFWWLVFPFCLSCHDQLKTSTILKFSVYYKYKFVSSFNINIIL